MGYINLLQNKLGDAEANFNKAYKIHKKLHNLRGQAADLGNLGLVAMDLGEYEMAKDYLEQSLAIYQELGVPVPEAVTKALDQLSNHTEQP